MGYRGFAVVLAGLSFFGCSSDDGNGGGGGTRVDCEWFKAANCWTEAVDAAYACAGDATGTFNAERTQCTGSGVQITFARPVPADLFEDDTYQFDVTVSSGANQCMHLVEQGQSSLDVETPTGLFRQFVQGNDLVLQCPDGSRYSMDAFAALKCAFDGLPGYGWSQSAGLDFYLLGKSNDSTLFECTGP